MTWRLRPATGDDLDAIMGIESVVFKNDAWSKTAMGRELANPQTHYLVAVRQETPAVLAEYAGLFAPSGAHEADIQTIAVADDARREGLGLLLMTTMIAESRSRGAIELFLDVRADNAGAQQLYRSLGFEEIALRLNYYMPDGVDAIVMRLPLGGVPEGAPVDAPPATPSTAPSTPSTDAG